MNRKLIKKLGYSDLDKIMNIHEKTIFPVWNSLGRKHDKSKIKEFVKEVLSKGDIYGYFEDKKILGILALNIREDGKGWIEFILVLPEFQGKEISKELIKFAEEYFHKKGIKNIILDVVQGNQRAVNFYKKSGYKITKEFEKDNVAKYIMEKKNRHSFSFQFFI